MPGHRYYDIEWDYQRQDFMPARPSRTAQPAPPTPAPLPRPAWTPEQIQETIAGQGMSEWVLNYIIPGPYPMDEVVVAVEAARQRLGMTELKVLTFRQRTNRNGPYLELLQSFSEPEYASLLRRRHRDITFYYEAQQRFRRRLVAKVLSGGAETYQLLLGPVVDDEELRVKLRSEKYSPARTAKSKFEAARKRMNDFRRDRAEAAVAIVLTPPPETPRGYRAQVANTRRRDNEARRRTRRG